MTKSRKIYGLLVIGLLIYFGTRIHNIDAIPLFIDESISTQRSVDIVNGTYLKHASTGKFLLPYYSIFYQPQFNTVYSVRLSLIIFTCLGLASAVNIAKRYGGLYTALIAMTLITFSPMLFFFDRFALTDTLLQAVITLWIFTLVVTFSQRMPNYVWAFISGCVFVISMLTKASTLFLIPLPFIYVLVLARWSTKQRFKVLSLLYTPIITVWIPFTVILNRQQINYFGKSDHIAPSVNELFDLDRIAYNFSIMLGGISNYHGTVFLIVAVMSIVLALRSQFRILTVLLAGLLGYGVALIWLGGYGLFIRYTAPMLPMLFIIIAIAIANIPLLNKKLSYILSVGLIGIWCITTALPFIHQIYNEPHLAPLSQEDKNEYINNNSSGYGIPELVDYLDGLSQNVPITVEGAFVSCSTLRFYANSLENITIQCPNILSGDRRAPYLNTYLPTQVEMIEHYYLIFETNGLINKTDIIGINMTLVQSFARPNNSLIQLYQVDSQ